MSKPANFSYSNTLTSTKQQLIDIKGTSNTGAPAVSVGIIGGNSRPNVNLGHNPQTSAEHNFTIAQNYIGPSRRPYPMKHWRRQLNVNGKSGRSATSISVVNRPGGTVFRGYTGDNICSCDTSGNNQYITFDNKFLQSNSRSIKPSANIPVASGTTNNKIQNNGSVVIVPGNNGYAIQTGIYNTKTICCTPENNVIKSAVTLLSKSYYSDNKAYLKSRCKLYSQKQSIQDISGNNYVDSKGNPIYPSDSPTGSQVFNTTNCAWPYINGTKNLCTKTIYKPSNAQFATQGAVDNGTRLAKLKYDTITKNGASFRNAFGEAAANAGKYQGGYNGSASYFLKSKYNPPLGWKRNGQKTICANGNTQCSSRQNLSSFWGSVN
jgi:hypothetical protein